MATLIGNDGGQIAIRTSGTDRALMTLLWCSACVKATLCMASASNLSLDMCRWISFSYVVS